MNDEPIGRSIPPIRARDRAVGASVAFIFAVLAVWVATGTAPSVIERSAPLVYWAFAGLIALHICIVLYFWRTAGPTNDNPYTKAGFGGGGARRWHRIGQICAVVFLGAVAWQGQIPLAMLLAGLAGVNWFLQHRMMRAGQRGSTE